MNYTDIIRDLLDQQYPDPKDTTTIIITTIQLRVLPAPAKPIFLRYTQLENLVLTKCDLRNLENFPKLTTLKALDLSQNSLQGTLNYLMPLVNLNYLNIAQNLIDDFRKLQPLQMIDNLDIYFTGNPFIEGEVWKNKVKHYGLKVLKQARVFERPASKIKHEEKKDQKKQQNSSLSREQNQLEKNKDHNQLLNSRRNSFLFEIRARRKRLEQQQRVESRRNALEIDSDSNSIIRVVRPNSAVLNGQLNNQRLSSEELNEDDSEDQNDNDKVVEEFFLNEEIEPLFQVFDHEDVEVEEDDEDHSEESSDS